MASWSIRNYNAFVREASKEYGLTRDQARQMYTNMSERLGRSLYGADLTRHPRISGQEATRAPKSEAAHRAAETRAERAREAREREPRARVAEPKAKSRRGREAPETEQPKVRSTVVHSSEEWLDLYDEDFDDADWEDWEGTPEYETSTAR